MLKIRDLRQYKGWTQKELAEKIGTNNKNVWAWESAKCEPCTEDLIKLSRIFDVSIDYLVGNTDDITAPFLSASANETLTRNEEELLTAFRALGIFEQGGILVQVKALAEQARAIKK